MCNGTPRREILVMSRMKLVMSRMKLAYAKSGNGLASQHPKPSRDGYGVELLALEESSYTAAPMRTFRSSLSRSVLTMMQPRSAISTSFSS